MKRNLVLEYMRRLRKAGIIPNFYISYSYLYRFQMRNYDGALGIYMGEGWTLAPPIYKTGKLKSDVKNIYASFPLQVIKLNKKGNEFLDYNYIYDPKDWMDLSGRRWKTTRKNTREWIEKLKKKKIKFQYEIIGENEGSELLEEWAGDREIFDLDFLIDMMFNDAGKCVSVRYKKKLIACLLFDYNWMFLNFRWIVCRKEKNLDEFCRFLFYTQIAPRYNRMVNDGGCLGCDGLKRFKERLNPKKTYKIYTLNKRNF